ncbi:extracellular substrate binding-like orphan protein GrrP [Synechococcus sp. RS9916]|uniref:extracellular substrate binding-like orphan protein GrrP n=1 Tax=Synechococcus sp. RS9916 TaxID=221359 RepID=UPI0000E53CCE|nr:extracellular substrate binding-like orphan protein GrrP [Synechococcus sp. RS9916]EAU72967.1 possible ABC transporter, solute binding protein [Synechococcus sp. RS9916]
MSLRKRASCALLALSAIGLVACQKPAEKPESSSANAFETGTLRAVVIGSALPMVEKSGSSYDGLSFVVLEAIRDQMKWAPQAKADQFSIEPVAVSSPREGLDKIRSGEADIACGVAFSWERQRTLDFTIPFANGGVRVLAPKGTDGTPDGLKGKTIGVVQNSVAADVLAASIDDAQFKFFEGHEQALAALKGEEITVLGGDSLWLKANRAATAPDAVLVPDRPYARSGVGCVVGDATPHLLNVSNLAIGRLLSGYVANDPAVRSEINRWIGSGSAVGLKDDQISTFFRMVLGTTAQLSAK